MGLDVEWLKVFDEIYKTSSVSVASERLGISQASASITLRKLREHFNDLLFSRTGRGMQPTPRAQALQPVIRRVVEDLEQARSSPQVFNPAVEEREFTICMTDISQVVLIPRLMNQLRVSAPGVRIRAETITTASARRLEDGEVDVAVGFMPGLDAGFYQTVLLAQHFVCVAAKRHPRIEDRLTKAAYVQESHVVVASSGSGYSVVEKVFAATGVKRQIALTVPSFLGVESIVAETELIATVPLRFAEAMRMKENIKILPVPYSLPHYDVKIHWHERFNSDAGNVWLRRMVSKCMKLQQEA
ncbi:MAG: LysR family transcriptional regulator [Polaromonas sp.]|jgi:DNA-binding transcriptional LysR family regulator|nr:LysR family transcriptional regulator [Polaromonas sp.]